MTADLIARIEGATAAYNAGYDCGQNGPNTVNCHFSLFSTPENTMAWERGKNDGTLKARESGQ